MLPDSTLYVLVVEEPKGPAAEKLSALQDTLDTARESLRANALEKALQDLNNADSQVLVITEMLPAEEPKNPRNPIKRKYQIIKREAQDRLHLEKDPQDYIFFPFFPFPFKFA